MAIDGPASLMGVYFNEKMARRDHVVVYHVPAWRRLRDFEPSREILESRLFPMEDLPANATDATRQRVAEHLGRSAISPLW